MRLDRTAKGIEGMRYGIHTKAHDELAAMTVERDRLRAENLELHAEISMIKSPEVCAAAHDNVETCGYCQRDKIAEALKKYGAHYDWCRAVYPPDCSCGFWKALNECSISGPHA